MTNVGCNKRSALHRHGCLIGVLALLFAANAQALDFELPLVDGGKFQRLSNLSPRITLVNFWRADCPPCIAELPLLVDAAQRLGFRLVSVALQTPGETRAHWPRVPGSPGSHVALLGPSEPRGLLRRFGNASGAIPYSAMLRPDGSLCVKRMGEIEQGWITDNLAKCGT